MTAARGSERRRRAPRDAAIRNSGGPTSRRTSIPQAACPLQRPSIRLGRPDEADPALRARGAPDDDRTDNGGNPYLARPPLTDFPANFATNHQVIQNLDVAASEGLRPWVATCAITRALFLLGVAGSAGHARARVKSFGEMCASMSYTPPTTSATPRARERREAGHVLQRVAEVSRLRPTR